MNTEDKAAQRAALEQQLKEAMVGFDPSYAFSDDHGYFIRQKTKAALIADLQKRLAALGDA